jgi:hypothetical protein
MSNYNDDHNDSAASGVGSLGSRWDRYLSMTAAMIQNLSPRLPLMR